MYRSVVGVLLIVGGVVNHDSLCSNQSEYFDGSILWPARCECELIARIRADEREKADSYMLGKKDGAVYLLLGKMIAQNEQLRYERNEWMREVELARADERKKAAMRVAAVPCADHGIEDNITECLNIYAAIRAARGEES